ncbi:pilus assembly PilX family protein [Paracidovorax oryzae]|uniref:pilus assembly PilX family protein n=1 Tax=Paracidovorax oryzae TaxID=862720 RepID=UPI0035D124A9
MRHPFPCSARSAPRLSRPSFARGGQQRGVSLIVVLILLVIISILGIGAAQLSMMGERGSRNERDLQIAWQGAEAGLMDAEFDMRGPGTSNRMGVFTKNDSSAFVLGSCGANNSGNSAGLCDPSTVTGKPLWLSTDLAADTPAATLYGTFTSRTFTAGASGLQPAKKPRYIIEVLPDRNAFGDASGRADKKFVYRVTSMGFGPRADIQAVTQMLFRKE